MRYKIEEFIKTHEFLCTLIFMGIFYFFCFKFPDATFIVMVVGLGVVAVCGIAAWLFIAYCFVRGGYMIIVPYLMILCLILAAFSGR